MRAAEREINELNLQLGQNRVGVMGGANQQEAQRIQFLREEIAKKQVQINAVQREYRAALEERTENAIRGAQQLPPSIVGMAQQSSPPPRSAAADQHNMYRLEQELTEIKTMLNDLHSKNKLQNAERITDLMAQLDADDQNVGGTLATDPMMFSLEIGANEDETEDWVKRQKAEIKQLQVKLEAAKKDFKQNQAEVEAIRLEDPNLYRKKLAVLDKVKLQLEKKIERMNQRIAKVKEIEAKLRNR